MMTEAGDMPPLKHRVARALAHRRKMQEAAAAHLAQLAAQRKIAERQAKEGSTS